ncbi:MAG TPA: RNA methyltransferase [Alphaproteobacteria bacterium]|jgi:tRNA G18 (ribose-2'-O)-methylase SpoU|nr:RNA methyltransferase [Alphaproteobacteria bacterium]
MQPAPTTRGYFGIGVERLSKPLNAGNLFRSAHAFGASFLFTVAGQYGRAHSDTSRAAGQVPLYEFASVEELSLPDGCRLVGIELMDEAEELPRFRHPPRAAYVLGPERGSLSAELLTRCDHVVKIPTRFCINVAMAGAIVMYDRLLSSGAHGRRAVSSLQRGEPRRPHVHGPQIVRSRRAPD